MIMMIFMVMKELIDANVAMRRLEKLKSVDGSVGGGVGGRRLVRT